MIRRLLLMLVLLGVLAGVALSAWGWRALSQPLAGDGEQVTVLVVRGDTLSRVIDRLAADGHLAHPLALRLWARWRGGSLHVGEYELAVGRSAHATLETLLSGRTVQRSVTLVEGWNFRQVRAALATQPRLLQTIAGESDEAVMARLGAPGLHPEGRFAPDTYFFSPQVDADIDILRRAYAAQGRRLSAAWEGRAAGLPYRNADELLVMASIVEKETGQPAERPDIAGVFVRRLRLGMRLQTDPTVIYGLGPAFDGNLTRAHLRQPTPWNTYVIDGLPPTPIAMPGAAALEAAAHPADGDALYFVGRGDGTHQFSATLEAHNAAVRRYQLQRRADYHSAPKQP